MADRNLPEVWEVEWEDASTSHNWHKDKAAREEDEERVVSVGFLIEDSPKRVLLSLSTIQMPQDEFNYHARFDCVTTIPKSAVRKMRRLKKERK